MDAILCLTVQSVYESGMHAIRELKKGQKLAMEHPNVHLWPNSFSAMQVIVNRTTPAHRDPGAAPSVYDLLLSVGTHKTSRIKILDIQTSFGYCPGTVILVCGRILRHEVMEWEGGERICIAHYIRDVVHQRLEIQQPDWVQYRHYTALMAGQYRVRQGV